MFEPILMNFWQFSAEMSHINIETVGMDGKAILC